MRVSIDTLFIGSAGLRSGNRAGSAAVGFLQGSLRLLQVELRDEI